MLSLDDFHDLTEAETGLIEHLREGKPGAFRASDGLPPADAPPGLHIRASLIRALILRQVTGMPLPERGLRIEGAVIRGDGPPEAETPGLDLEGATLQGDLALVNCDIPDMVLLNVAEVKNVALDGSRLASGIMADGLSAKGYVLLRRVTSAGEIRLLGAQLGGNLECDGATLTPIGNALSADSLTVKGNVFLRGVSCSGEIRLLGAKLGGGLECDDAIFTSTGHTLNADGLSAEGDVFLRRVSSAGDIRLIGVQLGGNLECDGVKLEGAGCSLNCGGAKISGAWFWRGSAHSRGAIDLTAAEIGSICDDPGCWPPEIR